MELTTTKTIINRIFLRPEYKLHLGHLGSIYYNYSLLTQNPKSQCVIIIDDMFGQTNLGVPGQSNLRVQGQGNLKVPGQSENCINEFIQDIMWLKLKKIKIIKLSNYIPILVGYAIQLVWGGLAVIQKNIIYYKGKDQSLLPLIKNFKVVENGNGMGNGNGTGNGFAHNITEDLVESDSNIRNDLPKISTHYAIIMIDLIEDVNLIVEQNNKYQISNAMDEVYQSLFTYFNKRIPTKIYHQGFKINNFKYYKNHLDNLINSGSLEGFDDPRLLTIAGLRKKGYPTKIIKKFCVDSNKLTNVNIRQLDIQTKNYLLYMYSKKKKDPLQKIKCHNNSLYKGTSIIDPTKVILLNWPENKTNFMVRNNFKNLVPLSKIVWIEKMDSLNLQVDDIVKLKFSYYIKIKKIIDNFSKEREIHVEVLESYYLKNDSSEFMNWISTEYINQKPITAQFNFFRYFYLGKGNLLNYQRRNGYVSSYDLENFLKKISGKLDSQIISNIPLSNPIFNFDKLGFFSLDLEHFKKTKKLVFNLIVGLPKINRIIG